MPPFRIAVIPGDGIGQEVVPEGMRVLDAVAPGRFAYEQFPWGCQYYLSSGRMMDADGLERLRALRPPSNLRSSERHAWW